ncbi:hypothetical protein BDW66DRAFT_162684 [Aspergillus desertorum]
MSLQGTLTFPAPLSSAPAGACSPPRRGRPGVHSRGTPCVRSCTSMIRDPTIHWKLFNLVLSTFLLLINLAIYIAFAVLRAIKGPWLYIVLTFILLTIGVIWCHALCRFVVAIYEFSNYTANCTLPIEMTETAGYARPSQPIHVIMAGDEERFPGSHSTGTAVKVATPPPAYGLWRNSVRLDPSLLHWQIVENSSRKAQGRRPPSYMSDDGVETPIVRHMKV